MPRNYVVPVVDKDYVQSQFIYEKGKGLLWASDKPKCKKGTLVGGSTPRSTIRLNSVRVLVSHVVWFLHHDYWPSERKEWVDHADGNCLNNTIENLRVASPSQNSASRNIARNKGVSINSNGTIRSIIQHKGKRYYLGSFKTEAEAAAAYRGASKILHYEFSVSSIGPDCHLGWHPL